MVVAAALFLVAGCSSAQSSPKLISTPKPLPIEVLNPLPDNAPIPTESAIADAIALLIHSPALGKHVGIAVADVRSRAIIYLSPSDAGDDRFIPASAIKLFTSTAVLLKDDPEKVVTFKKKSLSLSRLVEITLTESDNSGADLLSTLIPGSVSSEISNALPELDLKSTTIIDASGLSREDRTSPADLVRLLLVIAEVAHPQLSPIISGLPISGLSGTLKSRVLTAPGQIRAKTGTLTGVDVLAGYLVDNGKRALAFAIMADRVPKTEPGRKIVDKIAVALLKLS